MILHKSYKIQLLQYFRKCGFLAIIFAIIYALLPVSYEASDDATMMLISSGYFTPNPDYHLVFIHSIVGLIISQLEAFYSPINWYASILVIVLIVSYGAIWRTLDINSKENKLKNAFKLFGLSMFVYSIITFQFTFVSIAATFAGLLLMFYHSFKRFGLFGIFLFSVGIALRFETALIISVFYIIGGVFLKLLKTKTLISQIGVILVLFAILKISDALVYQNSGTSWWEYYQLKSTRQKLNNNSQFRNLKDSSPHIFKANTDQLGLLYDFFSDPEYFDNANLLRIYKVAQGQEKNYLYMLRLTQYVLPIFILFALWLLVTKRKIIMNWRGLIVPFSIFLLYIAVLAYLNLDSRVNNRAFLSVSAGMLLLILFISQGVNQFYNAKGARIGIFAMALLVLTNSVKNSVENYNSLEYAQRLNKWLMKYDSLNIVVFPGGSLSTKNHAYLENKPYFVDRGLKFSGWISGAPLSKNTLDSYQDLLQEDTFLLIEKKDSTNILRLERVFKDVYNLNVTSDVISTNETAKIIKFNQNSN